MYVSAGRGGGWTRGLGIGRERGGKRDRRGTERETKTGGAAGEREGERARGFERRLLGRGFAFFSYTYTQMERPPFPSSLPFSPLAFLLSSPCSKQKQNHQEKNQRQWIDLRGPLPAMNDNTLFKEQQPTRNEALRTERGMGTANQKRSKIFKADTQQHTTQKTRGPFFLPVCFCLDFKKLCQSKTRAKCAAPMACPGNLPGRFDSTQMLQPKQNQKIGTGSLSNNNKRIGSALSPDAFGRRRKKGAPGIFLKRERPACQGPTAKGGAVVGRSIDRLLACWSRAVLPADWTCGGGGSDSSCVPIGSRRTTTTT